MSFPTNAPVPAFVAPSQINAWVRSLTEYLTKHLSIFAWPEQRIILTNGDNNNIDLKGGSFVHIIGPTAAFRITGFGRGTPGREIIIHNASSGTLTLGDENPSSQGPNRIHTFVGDITTPIATLLYDHLSQRWIVTQSNTGTSTNTLPVFEVPTPAPNDVVTTFSFSTSWSDSRLAFFRNGMLQRLVNSGPLKGEYTIVKPSVTTGFPPLAEDHLFGIYWPL